VCQMTLVKTVVLMMVTVVELERVRDAISLFDH